MYPSSVHPLNRHERRLIRQVENPARGDRCISARPRFSQTRDIHSRQKRSASCRRIPPRPSRSSSTPVDSQVKLCASINFTRTWALTSSALSFQVYSPPAPKLSQPRLASPTDPVPAYYLRVTPRDLDRAGSRIAGASPPP